MAKEKPKCETLLPWLRSNLGKKCLAPLTGQDAKALAAAVQIIELYSYHRNPAVLKAFATVVMCMQVKCFVFAYHSIAHVMDWSDRTRVWLEAGLPGEIEYRTCAYEPGGTMRDAP